MSALEGTAALAVVFPAAVAPGEFGADELVPGDPSGPGIEVYGTTSRPSATALTTGGFDVDQQIQFRARAFPWPARSVVYLDDELWDVVATPIVQGRSELTRVVVVTLAARGRGAPSVPTGEGDQF